jgi:hypothetical protein
MVIVTLAPGRLWGWQSEQQQHQQNNNLWEMRGWISHV